MLKEQFEKNKFLVGLLVIIFVIMGTYYYYEFKELKKEESKFQKARIGGVCPDYWENVSISTESGKKSGKCKNTHNIGICNLKLDEKIKDFGEGTLYSNTETGPSAKCYWSKMCKSPWEGYDHLCGDIDV